MKVVFKTRHGTTGEVRQIGEVTISGTILTFSEGAKPYRRPIYDAEAGRHLHPTDGLKFLEALPTAYAGSFLWAEYVSHL